MRVEVEGPRKFPLTTALQTFQPQQPGTGAVSRYESGHSSPKSPNQISTEIFLKVGMFSEAPQQPTTNHKLPPVYHQLTTKNHQLPPIFRKTPCKKTYEKLAS